MQKTRTCKSVRSAYNWNVLRDGRNFTPDSGKLVHLRTPRLTETVRVDAGFVAGDDISSFYDPMISKLIVRGPTRASAIQKLCAALEDYEVAGPVTNIEFLKALCRSEAFERAELETSFIEKHREVLFQKKETSDEVFAQAALALIQEESVIRQPQSSAYYHGAAVGFGATYQDRSFSFTEIAESPESNRRVVEVQIRQVGWNIYDIRANDSSYSAVEARLDLSSRKLTSFYPHTRLETTVINDCGKLTLFQRGRQYRLQCPRPEWMAKALGVKEAAASVLAPMPCKILRVDVEEGMIVKKQQPLMVIESMKMETTIRSPQDGTISRVVHKKGVSYRDAQPLETLLTGYFRIFAKPAQHS